MFKMLRLFPFFMLLSCRVGENFMEQSFISEGEIQQTLQLTPTQKNSRKALADIFNDNDLNTLLNFAYKNNLDVKQNISRLQQSRYTFLIQSKQNFPMLNALVNYDFNKTNSSHNFALSNNFFKLGFDASWELDIWGKGQYISEQYFELIRNAQYSLLNLYISLSAEVAANYIHLKKHLELLRIAHKNLKLQKDILQTVEDKYTAGIADDLALSQAKYSVEQTKSQIPQIEFQINLYTNTLAILLGVLPQKLPINFQKRNSNIVSTPFKYDVQNLHSLPLEVIRKRPDVIMAEALVRSKNAALNEAITNLYPTVSLSAFFTYLSSSGHTLFQSNSQYYGYSPNILQPIWHWKQLKNNIELQKHIKDEYVLAYNETILTSVLEIKNAIHHIEESYKENKHLQISKTKMQNILNLTYEKYKNGIIDFTDVAHAEQNLLSAQNAVINSNSEILLAIIAFYKAIGGEFENNN